MANGYKQVLGTRNIILPGHGGPLILRGPPSSSCNRECGSETRGDRVDTVGFVCYTNGLGQCLFNSKKVAKGPTWRFVTLPLSYGPR